MTTMTGRQNVKTSNLRAMLNNWAIALAAPVAVELSSYVVPKLWMPLVAFSMAYLLSLRLRFDSGRQNIKGCNLVIWTVTWAMVWTAIVMCTINLLYAKWFATGIYHIDPINLRHPFITPLVLFPTTLAVSLFVMSRKRKSSHCQRCMERFGYYDREDSRVTRLYYDESRFQLRSLAALSLLISAIDWFYYFKFYINVNLNTPDRFFFNALPIILLILAVVYMAVRYITMADAITAKQSAPQQQLMTMVRYLILSNDTLCLSLDPEGYLDTPAVTLAPRHERLSDDEVADSFRQITGVNDFSVKYLYTDTGYAGGPNVFHYAVFVPPAEVASLKLSGSWLTLDQIDRQIKSRGLSPELLGEIYRIYRVTMAWKTYDRQGNRLYPIKNYQPTFRLRDLPDWNVDYDDRHWLEIAANNRDRRLFRLRRILQKAFRH